jgi:hypothetical protein
MFTLFNDGSFLRKTIINPDSKLNFIIREISTETDKD